MGASSNNSRWRIGVAGAFVVMGIVSLVFALGILLGTSQVTPVLMIALAGWFASLIESEGDQK